MTENEEFTYSGDMGCLSHFSASLPRRIGDEGDV